MIEENIGFERVKRLFFYHNEKLNYDKQNALYSGVANIRKKGLKIAILTILLLIYNKLKYSQ